MKMWILNINGLLVYLYIKKLKKQISIRIDLDTINFFKKQAELTGITYQNLMNLYLSDCAAQSKQINIAWK